MLICLYKGLHKSTPIFLIFDTLCSKIISYMKIVGKL